MKAITYYSVLVFFGILWSGLFAGTSSAKGESSMDSTTTHTAASVLVFVLRDCPICNDFAPVITRMSKEYEQRGVSFRLVYVDDDVDEVTARKHTQDYFGNLPFTCDPGHSLARSYFVDVVPSVVILDARNTVLYRGRIDDRFADVQRRRPEATRHDLKEAIEAILAGKKPVVSVTQSVGCLL